MSHAIIASALLAAFAVTGCSFTDPTDPTESNDAELVFSGRVTYTHLEGGAWVLVSDAGETYEPLNLPSEYRQEGLRVRVEAEHRRDRVSVLMVGPIIEIKRLTRL